MALDTSMYSRANVPDILGAVQQGLSMRDLIDQRSLRDKKAKEQEAIKSAVVTAPDGSIDQKATLSSLAKISPETAMKFQQQFSQQRALDLDTAAKEVDMSIGLLSGVKDQATYDMALNEAKRLGLSGVDQLPAQYSPEMVESLLGRGLSYKDRLAAMRADRQLDQKDRELGIKEREASQKAQASIPLTVAEEAVDKDYAKHYTKYTATGRTNAVNTIEKLEALADEVERDGQGFFAPGGTRFEKIIPDFARRRKSVEWRDDARNFANKTLKELFGGQLSDAEREAAAREYWNDALDNESNVARLRGKIKELKDNLAAQDAQARYFEQNRTLQGFRFTPNEQVGPGGDSRGGEGDSRIRLKGDQIEWAD